MIYGEGENFLQEVFPLSIPLPFSRTLAQKEYLNRFVSARGDGRREHKVRFGYRKKSGTTETLIFKKVVWHWCGASRTSPPTNVVYRMQFRHTRNFVKTIEW